MISVQHNMLAINADRQLNVNTKKNTKITEKLSSGYRINRAADDAAGLAISEKMRRQIRGLHQAADNIKDGIGYVQTAEGALNEVHDMLQRMNELSVKAATGTNTEQDRAYIDNEVQALKKEIDRVFSTTAFNEQRIWEPEKVSVIESGGGVPETGGSGGVPETGGSGGDKNDNDITWVTETAVTFNGGSTSLTGGVTNANCGVLATSSITDADGKILRGGYKLLADDNGVTITWTGYDKNTYSTEIIPWEKIAVDDKGVYSFNMEDYFGAKDETNKLYSKNADTGEFEPVFTKTVSFTVNSYAAKHFEKYKQDIIKSINGARMSSSVRASMSVKDDDCTNISSTPNSDGIYVDKDYGNGILLNYAAAYLSQANGSGNGYNFDAADDALDDAFIEPNSNTGNLTSNPIAGNDDNGTWSFSFNMAGIGTVTATSKSTAYYSEKDEYGTWWHYNSFGLHSLIGYPATYQDRGGNLGSVKEAVSSLPTDSDGYIYLNFTITPPDNKTLTYGENDTLTEIGSFSICISVSAGDTEDDVLNKIEKALNNSTDAPTVLDFTRNSDSASIGGLRGTSTQIQIPDPNGPDPDDDDSDDDDDDHDNDNNGGNDNNGANEEVYYNYTKKFWVQAGAEAGQHIDIEYESLNIQRLGIADTNTLTAENSDNAINEVKEALQIVSKQRSDFGAYQNRLEHAYNIDKNVEENTQAAESLIRDTDIAEAMMEYSVNNILMQAGVSMLTQANQSSQLILELLG